MIYGIQPGPMMIAKYPDLFWGTVMSMYLGNAMLLVLNLPLIGLWVQVLKVPYPILFPIILLFCLVGVFSLNYSSVEVALMIGFGVFGYLARKFQYEMAPLVLALVLGPMMENNVRLSLVISQGDPMIFVTHPISARPHGRDLRFAGFPLHPLDRQAPQETPGKVGEKRYSFRSSGQRSVMKRKGGRV